MYSPDRVDLAGGQERGTRLTTLTDGRDEPGWPAAAPRPPPISPWLPFVDPAEDGPAAAPAPARRRRLRWPVQGLRGASEQEVGRACTALVESSEDLVVILLGDGTIRHASGAATILLGRPAPWLAGHPLASLVHPQDRTALDDLREVTTGARRASPVVELRLSHMNGGWVTVDTTAVDLRHVPAVGGLVLTMRDMARWKAFANRLWRMAHHDPLTNLADRALFRQHVEAALSQSRRSAVSLAVLFVDLDGFKTVNDSLGHAAGDEVLRAVAGRLRSRVRPGDTAARLGGDEFAVLMENSSEQDAGVLAQRLLEAFADPIVVQGQEVVISGSVGIAGNAPGLDADDLLRNADVAMYRAKAAGKNRSELFRPEMQRAALRRLVLEADLRRALERGELTLHYQPIIGIGTGRIVAMEALVRWRHPVRGIIPPGDFIGLAEDCGLIRPLGRWVLAAACRQGRLWSDRHPELADLHICVNTSVRQIVDERFTAEVARCLSDSGLSADRLTLEITESLFLNDFEETVAHLCDLKALGLKLAIDDFGTGYSSLNYLRYLPVDILKIDKTFVDGVTRGHEQSAVARAVVKLARTFSLRTVAEGIETAEQLAVLKEIGADMAQGYHVARPLDATAMETFLARFLPPRPPERPPARIELPPLPV